MSYLTKLLEGYWTGIRTTAGGDRTKLAYQLAIEIDPYRRGLLVGAIAALVGQDLDSPSPSGANSTATEIG